MWTKRIDLESKAGHVVIERTAKRAFVITSTLNDEKCSGQASKTWERSTGIYDDELMQIAIEVQQRSDGYDGSNSEVHDYFREMQRFQD